MIFTIEKRDNGTFWHYIDNVKIINISRLFTPIYEEISNTFVVQCANGSNVPQNPIKANNVIVRVNGVDDAPYNSVMELKERLIEIGYDLDTTQNTGGNQNIDSVLGVGNTTDKIQIFEWLNPDDALEVYTIEINLNTYINIKRFYDSVLQEITQISIAGFTVSNEITLEQTQYQTNSISAVFGSDIVNIQIPNESTGTVDEEMAFKRHVKELYINLKKTTTEINAITNPKEGESYYNTDLHTICFFDGSVWKKVSSTNM